MRRRVILPLLLAAFAYSGVADAHEKQNAVRDGSTEERAIVIPHSKRPFDDLAWVYIRQRYRDATQSPYESDVRSPDHGRTWTVAIYFSTKFHGRRTMYFKTTWRHLTGK